MWLLHREATTLVPKLLEKYRDQLLPPLKSNGAAPGWIGEADGIVPIRLKALLEEPDSTIKDEEAALDRGKVWVAQQERDEYEAIEEAISDLVRLVRYERRAWSRQKRAISEFANHQVTRHRTNSDPSPGQHDASPAKDDPSPKSDQSPGGEFTGRRVTRLQDKSAT
jgi:hypothetical protein